MRKQKNGQKDLLRLRHADSQRSLHCRKNRGKRLGVDQLQQRASVKVIRLKQEPEQMRLFDRKADIIHSDPKRSALLRLFDPHQIVRMVLVRLRIDCPFQFFNRREMIHDGLRGAVQPFRYGPCTDGFRARFTGNRKGCIHDHFPCNFCFCRHRCASIYNLDYI